MSERRQGSAAISTRHATGMVKRAFPDRLSLRLSNKEMTTANTAIVIQCEWIKIIPIFCQIGKKIFFLVCRRTSVISVYVPWVQKVKIAELM